MEATTIKLVGKRRVNPNEIVLLRADANYTEVLLEDGEQIIVSKTLKEMEKTFTAFSSFYRIHKSYMVNMEHVDSVQVNGGNNEVKLKNNMNAFISRRRKDAFISQLRKRVI